MSEDCDNCGHNHSESDLTEMEEDVLGSIGHILTNFGNDFLLEIFRAAITEMYVRLKDPADLNELLNTLMANASEVFDPERTPYPDALASIQEAASEYRARVASEGMAVELDDIIHKQGVLGEDDNYGKGFV